MHQPTKIALDKFVQWPYSIDMINQDAAEWMNDADLDETEVVELLSSKDSILAQRAWMALQSMQGACDEDRDAIRMDRKFIEKFIMGSR